MERGAHQTHRETVGLGLTLLLMEKKKVLEVNVGLGKKKILGRC